MSKLRELIGKARDMLFPWCPSGLAHRARGGIVTNVYGNRYCYHRDCIRANYAEVTWSDALAAIEK